MPTAADPRFQAQRQILNALSMLPDGRAGFSHEQLDLLRPLLRAKPLVFLAFPPKCGGTFLCDALANILAARGATRNMRGSFIPAGDQEQDLYFPDVLLHFLTDRHPFGILHNHPTATSGNRALIGLFGLKPVLMKRPILDMLRSRHDQAHKLGSLGGHGSGLPDRGFLALPLERQKDFLIYNVAPWYVKYYASWLLAQRAGMEVLFLEYESFRQDPLAIIARILAFNGLDVPREEIARGLVHSEERREALRFNQGISGRGQAFFEPHHHEHLRRLVQSYTEIDLVAEGVVGAAPA